MRALAAVSDGIDQLCEHGPSLELLEASSSLHATLLWLYDLVEPASTGGRRLGRLPGSGRPGEGVLRPGA